MLTAPALSTAVPASADHRETACRRQTAHLVEKGFRPTHKRREVGRLGAGALDAEDHIRSGERRVVMKGNVRAEFELPGGRVQRLPCQGELWNDRQVGIDVEQRLLDLLRRH